MRPRIAGILLAAGEGSRLGQPKALVEIGGQRLADRGVDLLRAGGADPIVVVTGAAPVNPPGTLVVPNAEWRTGMGSSLAAGLTALRSMPPDHCRAAVIALADQPLVGAESVRRLIAAYIGRVGEPPGSAREAGRVGGSAAQTGRVGESPGSARGAGRAGESPGSAAQTGRAGEPPGSGREAGRVGESPGSAAQTGRAGEPPGSAAHNDADSGRAGAASIVVAAYDGRPRNPVLIAREHWDEVLAMAQGDAGARPFLRAHPELVTLVECGDIGSPDDIDTPEDLTRIAKVLGENSSA